MISHIDTSRDVGIFTFVISFIHLVKKPFLGFLVFSTSSSFLICYPILQDLLEKITSFRDELNEIKDNIGCCLVTLMSHGEEGFIKMKDGEKVSLEDIFEMFNNKNCPALQEKPKIFIIQACRGGKWRCLCIILFPGNSHVDD